MRKKAKLLVQEGLQSTIKQIGSFEELGKTPGLFQEILERQRL